MNESGSQRTWMGYKGTGPHRQQLPGMNAKGKLGRRSQGVSVTPLGLAQLDSD